MLSETRNVWLALALLLGACVLFLTLNVNGHWDFVLPLRLSKLMALLLVAYAVAVSTLLFQTITANPILTPAILGFDALYIFLQTLLVATLGAVGFSALSPSLKFSLELVLMVGGSLLLFQTLIKQGGRDLARMILIGVVFGILFRSLSSLLQRVIDPEAFAVVQGNMFASFNIINRDMLLASTVVMALSVPFIWRTRHKLDVYLLGRDQAINLGIHYTRTTLWLLFWIAALVATATALVGPVSFFGLLVCALTNHFAGCMKHAIRLPLAFCIAGILLIAGQAIFEHILGMKAVLSVVVEFAGGLVFLYLILTKKNYD